MRRGKSWLERTLVQRRARDLREALDGELDDMVLWERARFCNPSALTSLTIPGRDLARNWMRTTPSMVEELVCVMASCMEITFIVLMR